MNDQQSSGLMARLREMWQQNSDLLRNAGSLAATTGLTSVFGFVFWIVAAHDGFTKAEIGYGSAATNAMQLFGTIGMFGLGTMLIGELPRRRERGGLFSASVITSAVGSLILGLGFAVVCEFFFAKRFPEVSGTLPAVLLFAVGTMVTGATLVFDEGTIGMMRGGVQLWRNLFMSGIKLVALPVTAVLLHDQFGMGINLSFVIGTVVSLAPALLMLSRSGSRIFHRPDWGLLRKLIKVAIAHNWLNLAIATPPRLIPVIVVVAVGPSQSGVFYIAFMISSFLFMVPVHLSTVLFAVASASPEVIAEKLRFVLRVCLMIGLPVMAVLAVGAHFALNIFGPGYAAEGTVPLWLLIAGYIPAMPKAQYIAVSRATNRVGRAALVLCAAALCELAALMIGGRVDGLDGLCLFYLGVIIVEGLVTAPTVLRAAYARTAAATGSFPAVTAETQAAAAVALAKSGPLARVTGELIRLTGAMAELPAGTVSATDRQENGLAALFALASAAVSNEHTLDVATEVWRTGAFPVLSANGTGPHQRPNAITTLDLLGGQTPGGGPQRRLSYRHRQQAGIDALIALADTDVPAEEPSRQPS